MTEFIRGIDLARAFYSEVVRSLLDVPHTACLIGEGSEILGYDTPRSADHEWGPRMQLFVAPEHVQQVRGKIADGLPTEFDGYPTAWYSLAQQRIAHHIEIDTLANWLTSHYQFDFAADFDHAMWLSIPQQHLLQLTKGAVFRDDNGELTTLRRRLAWYPTDVCRWLLATQWHFISTAQPLLGRTSEVGDIRGARLITYRLCRLTMEMAFLQERHYWPYDKWFGTAFSGLDAAATVGPLIDETLDSARPHGPLARMLIMLAHRHNALGLTASVPPTVGDFSVNINDAVRPYAVLNAREFIDATVESISDNALRNLARVGGIDQLTHADDTLVNFSGWPGELARNYRKLLADAVR